SSGLSRKYLPESRYAVGSCSRPGGYIALPELLFPLLITAHDLLHVRTRLAERRHAAIPLDVALAGVVGGDGVLQIAVETALQILEVLHAGIDVLFGIVEVLRSEPAAGARHDLHQSLRANGRAGGAVKPRFGLDDRSDQRWIDVVLLRLVVNQVAE